MNKYMQLDGIDTEPQVPERNNAHLRCDCGFHSSGSVGLQTVIVATACGDLQVSPAKESRHGNE